MRKEYEILLKCPTSGDTLMTIDDMMLYTKKAAKETVDVFKLVNNRVNYEIKLKEKANEMP